MELDEKAKFFQKRLDSGRRSRLILGWWVVWNWDERIHQSALDQGYSRRYRSSRGRGAIFGNTPARSIHQSHNSYEIGI